MFQNPPPLLASKPNQKRIQQHHESKKWVRPPADQRCFEPLGKPFLETAFGKVPPEVRTYIFKNVLTVESPFKDGISVPMTRSKLDCPERGIGTKPSIEPARPASCLALLQTCRQIYQESSLLFYSINTMYFSDPHELLLFLHHLGPVRCNALQSLHLEDFFPRRNVTGHKQIPPLGHEAMRLLNKTGNIRKIYLDMSPDYVVDYVELCTKISGLTNCEIAFGSPTRWSVMPPSTKWERWPWFLTYLSRFIRERLDNKPLYGNWLGNKKYRVEVDINRALSRGRLQRTDSCRCANGGIEGGKVWTIDTAMEDLRVSP